MPTAPAKAGQTFLIMCYSEWSVNALKNFVNQAQSARALSISEFQAAGRITPVEFKTNSKLNSVVTFSTLPVVDCGKACRECSRGCYAVRHCQGRNKSSMLQAARNSARLAADRDTFFDDIKRRASVSALFRWHEAGEVVDADYFARVVDVAAAVSTCQFLIFTKRFDIVNAFIQAGGAIPSNLHVLLSAWSNVAAVENPYNLPISAPDFSKAPEAYRRPFDACGLRVHSCGGDCFACAVSGSGCWGAGAGDLIRFAAH